MIFNSDLLKGQTILVTGASSGIGREYCIKAARVGARILLTGRNRDRLSEVLDSLEGSGHEVFPLELSSITEFKTSLLEITESNGPIHGVFHAAGIEIVDTLKRANDVAFDNAFTASVHG